MVFERLFRSLLSRKFRSAYFLALFLLELGLSAPLSVQALPGNAQTAELLETPRFTLYFPSSQKTGEPEVRNLVANTVTILDETYSELSNRFGARPQNKVVFRFLSPEEFRDYTGAPAWTSAMYLRGEVSIPIPRDRALNAADLRRAIRHEYVHAAVSELSGKKCPAWLDEGIAQLFEGEVNPLLGPSLRGWIRKNEPLPLSWLRAGFMTLEDNIVPVAYAQSLFATRLLAANGGEKNIADYFILLRRGVEPSKAFLSAFNVEEAQFERQLAKDLRGWASTTLVDP